MKRQQMTTYPLAKMTQAMKKWILWIKHTKKIVLKFPNAARVKILQISHYRLNVLLGHDLSRWTWVVHKLCTHGLNYLMKTGK